eukprot:7807288-Alexandrium_andersonii.AAC.1
MEKSNKSWEKPSTFLKKRWPAPDLLPVKSAQKHSAPPSRTRKSLRSVEADTSSSKGANHHERFTRTLPASWRPESSACRRAHSSLHNGEM